MEAAAQSFLQSMIETPSPSGYEGPIQQVVRRYAADFAERITADVHGNVILARNADAPMRVVLAGHCDQIGMLVTYVNDDGYIYTQTIGGWDPQQLIGQRMIIWTAGGPVPAVIARKPIHLLTDEERKQVVKTKDLWLDMGAKNRQEVESLVRIGDPVTLELKYQPLRNNLVAAPGMDDKTGVWVVVEALRRLERDKLRCGVFAVSTVQEEIGLRGARTSAYGIDPLAGVAVDVTHATDCPTIGKEQEGNIKLGAGPVIYRGPNMNPIVTEQLIETARRANIPYQLSACGRATPNDANSIQITRAGVATGLVSVPNRYMHSAVETVSLDDLDNAAELLARWVMQLTGEETFVL